MGRLALIAEELGRWDVIPHIVELMKLSYDPWVHSTTIMSVPLLIII